MRSVRPVRGTERKAKLIDEARRTWRYRMVRALGWSSAWSGWGKRDVIVGSWCLSTAFTINRCDVIEVMGGAVLAMVAVDCGDV